MITYKFSMEPKGTLVCYKNGKNFKKYTGNKAVQLLEHVKEFSFYTFNPILNKTGKNKYFYSLEFISNNHKVTYENIYNFQKAKTTFVIEDELRDIMHIIKKNNIAKEREELERKRKILNVINNAKAIIAGISLGATISLASLYTSTKLEETKVTNTEEYHSSEVTLNENFFYKVDSILYPKKEIDITKYISQEQIEYATTLAYLRLYNQIKEDQEKYALEKEQEEELVWEGDVLNSYDGVVYDTPSGGLETYYDADCISDYGMNGVIKIMREMGYTEEEYPYSIRDDGVRMFGDYVMVAANLDTYPRGTIIDTTLGKAIVCDACEAADTNLTQIDVAVNWTKNLWK